MAALFDTLVAQAPTFIRDGHNKILSTDLAPDGRTEPLRKLVWKVLPCPQDGFVLPDCVALAVDDQSELRPLMMVDLKEITAVLMPLSTERMLVGCREEATPVPTLDEFNEAAARASHSFFIAARFDERLKALANRVGESSHRMIEEMVGSTFSEFLAERSPALPAPTAVPNSDDLLSGGDAPDGGHEQEPPQAPRYSVHFLACADEPTANAIAAVLYR
ncbi:hypothetical protein [Bradyrhizobium sp.]|uniref:hypothetical protein n=1 Tax=Bradyrhizobium sp. TaxID=376 RepID=UPI0025C5E58C|nr:hypothetical protein [Bradyrhizobium sp.]